MTSLTTKELTGIEDQLTCEDVAIAKCQRFAADTQDPALKAKFNEVAQKHQQHKDQLLGLLG